MRRLVYVAAVAAAFLLGLAIPREIPALAAAGMTPPSQGWTLHIDADHHFGDAHPAEIAHHWCKAVAGGMTECQLYDSDAPNARLVGVETIVGPTAYKSFSAGEKAMWHYHKIELAKIHATLPGLTPAQQKKVIASIINTYGKVYVLYDPMATKNMPLGQPSVTVLK